MRDALPTATLGRTGLVVTRLGYGAMEVRGSRISVAGYLLAHANVHTTIVGTLKPDHLQENVAGARRGPLPADVYAEARSRLDTAGERPASAG